MNLDHIHFEFQAQALRPDRERIQFIWEERWLDYAAAREVLRQLKDLLDRPRIDRMPGLLITSDAFNGKTRLIRRLMALHGNGYVNEMGEPVKPIILTQSKGSDEKRLLISILERFHAPYNANNNPSKLYYQVIQQCRDCHVQMIAIDEMHELFTGSAKAQRNMMSALKLLMNELCIPIVGIGTHETTLAIHMSDQLSSRFESMKLPPWTFGKEYRKLLDGLERTLPLRQPSGLAERELANRIFLYSGGERIGDTRALVQTCAVEAIRSGQECIDLNLLEKFKSWKRPSGGMRQHLL